MIRPSGYTSLTLGAIGDGATVADAAVAAMQPPAPLTTRTLDAMLGDPALTRPIAYLVPGLIPCGALTLLYGRGKSGKSTFCHHLALAVARGTPFLGRAVPRGPVLWLDLEQGPRLWARNFAQTGAAVGDPALTAVHYLGGPLAAEDRVASIFATIDAVRPVLTVIDSAVRWLQPEDESDNGWWARILDPIVRQAQARDGALLVIDHGRKGGGQHGDALRGAGAKLDAADVAIFLDREHDGDGTRRRLEMVSRYDGDRQLTIDLTADGYVEADGRTLLAADAVLTAVDAGARTVAEVHAHVVAAGHECGQDWVRKTLKRYATGGTLVEDRRPSRQGGHHYHRPAPDLRADGELAAEDGGDA